MYWLFRPVTDVNQQSINRWNLQMYRTSTWSDSSPITTMIILAIAVLILVYIVNRLLIVRRARSWSVSSWYYVLCGLDWGIILEYILPYLYRTTGRSHFILPRFHHSHLLPCCFQVVYWSIGSIPVGPTSVSVSQINISNIYTPWRIISV